MGFRLEIKEEARQDIRNGFLWYEERKAGLGARFVKELEEFIIYISNAPNNYQIRQSNFREAVLKTFPFVIIYEVISDAVIVYAVFPTRKNPSKKPR